MLYKVLSSQQWLFHTGRNFHDGIDASFDSWETILLTEIFVCIYVCGFECNQLYIL